MLRVVIFILVSLLLITFIRMVAGIMFKGVGELFQPSNPSDTANNPPSGAPAGGELKRDPVCGTFVPVATSVKKMAAGQTLHFCSTDCRDRYQARQA